jgi:hypothetical protein
MVELMPFQPNYQSNDMVKQCRKIDAGKCRVLGGNWLSGDCWAVFYPATSLKITMFLFYLTTLHNL